MRRTRLSSNLHQVGFLAAALATLGSLKSHLSAPMTGYNPSRPWGGPEPSRMQTAPDQNTKRGRRRNRHKKGA